MLDFRVETFLTAAKILNFTKTSEILNITQPAVSQHIKWLEKEYGVKLFYQSGKKLYLSDDGKTLFDALTTISLDEKRLKTQFQNVQRKRHLKFGVTMTVGEYMIPDVLCQYINNDPSQDITMQVANTERLLNGLKESKIDFAVVEGYFPQSEYDWLPYSQEKYIAVCHPDSPFAKDTHSIKALLKSTIITREHGSGTREVLEHALFERNLSLSDFPSILEIGNLNTIKKLVASGCGIAFMYQVAAKDAINKKELCQIHISDFDITHDISFIWRKNSIYADHFKEIYYKFTLPRAF